METKQTCDNCKYFIRHYVLFDAGFMSTSFGHCCNCNIRRIRLIRHSDKDTCAKWELKQTNKDCERHDIECALHQMGINIKNVAALLQVLRENVK